jgi:mannose-1-phosphate guanylyltransferase
MKGFIFAAGFGKRLRPITERIAKPLVPVVNVPSICYSLLLFKKAGIKDLVINLHYKAEDIVRFFREHDDFGFKLTFSREETILGTGGGLKNCERFLSDEDFVVLNSDVVMDLDIGALSAFHRANKSCGTLVLYRTPTAQAIGPVGVREGRVIDFKNRLASDGAGEYIYTGAAVLSPVIFQYLTGEFSSIVYTGYTEIIRRHRLDYYEHKGVWEDVGSIETFRKTNIATLSRFEDLRQLFLEQLGLEAEVVSSKAVLHRNAAVNDSVIGDECVVGKGAAVERSVLLAGASVAEGCRLQDVVVTANGNVLV